MGEGTVQLAYSNFEKEKASRGSTIQGDTEYIHVMNEGQGSRHWILARSGESYVDLVRDDLVDRPFDLSGALALVDRLL